MMNLAMKNWWYNPLKCGIFVLYQRYQILIRQCEVLVCSFGSEQKRNMSIRENSFASGKKMNSQDQSWFCPQKENAASKAAWILFYLFHFQSHPRHEGTKYCLKRSPRFSSSSTKAEETSKNQGSLRSSGDFCLMFRLEKW